MEFRGSSEQADSPASLGGPCDAALLWQERHERLNRIGFVVANAICHPVPNEWLGAIRCDRGGGEIDDPMSSNRGAADIERERQGIGASCEYRRFSRRGGAVRVGHASSLSVSPRDARPISE